MSVLPRIGGYRMGGQENALKPGGLGGHSRRESAGRQTKRPRCRPPPLSIDKVLAWADEYHDRTGKWPQYRSGRVEGSSGETWREINHCLADGRRGLGGGSSLAKLLAEYRGVRNLTALPSLTVKRILKWPDAHYARTGRWPGSTSGAVHDAPGESWHGISVALNNGGRGLPARLSLNAVLARHRGVPKKARLPRWLSIKQILAWVDAYHQRTGKWPNVESGSIEGKSGSNWRALDLALRRGYNGLPGGMSLHQLLVQERGVRKRYRSLG